MSAGPPPTLTIAVRQPLDRFELAVDVQTTARVTGLFGPSGSGKTSVLEHVAGLRRGGTGRVTFGGAVWLDSTAGVFARPETRGIGYVPQEGLLFPHLTVRQNLEAGRRRAEQGGHDVATLMRDIADLLELTPLLGRRVAALSGGERQRVALGRALGSGPGLLLLDEPLGALDLALKRRVLPLLRDVLARFAVPALLVSHDPAEIQALCDDVVVLREGRVVARGAPNRVLTDPAAFSADARRDFDNVLVGTLESSAGETSILRAGDGLRLIVPLVEAPIGSEHLVAIRAQDVIVASSRPEGLSARNLLPARLTGLEAVGHTRLVSAELDPALPPIAVELTDGACDELGLRSGQEVVLVVKASACRVFGQGGQP